MTRQHLETTLSSALTTSVPERGVSRHRESVREPVVQEIVSPVEAAETIFRRFAPRAVTLLTSPRTLEDGRVLPPRLSANDCYVVMEEACRKMARVALRKFEAEPTLHPLGFAQAMEVIFPDPVAYLARAIRSVVSDAERQVRRDVPTISMDQPLAGGEGDNALCLRDTLATLDRNALPEETLLDQDERLRFRTALIAAFRAIPKNYLLALERDMARERERLRGVKLAPESDRERQTVCRARAALTEILKRECGTDNPFVRLLVQGRSSRVRQKTTKSPNWTAERQQTLFRRLLETPWADRTQANAPDDATDYVGEAVVNEVSKATGIAPPSPEMRRTMRVMDVYTFTESDAPSPENPEVEKLYDQAQELRDRGKIEEALQRFRAVYEAEPTFFAALNEVGVLLSRLGNLRDALKVYLTIVENPNAGDQRFIAATNAADIHLIWFDAGRNREKNIERATHYARMAMEKPTPMRACNLLLAYVKDRYYLEARQVLGTVLRANLPTCPSEKFLQTLFQIRDADLVAWWNWLDGEMGKE